MRIPNEIPTLPRKRLSPRQKLRHETFKSNYLLVVVAGLLIMATSFGTAVMMGYSWLIPLGFLCHAGMVLWLILSLVFQERWHTLPLLLRYQARRLNLWRRTPGTVKATALTVMLFGPFYLVGYTIAVPFLMSANDWYFDKLHQGEVTLRDYRDALLAHMVT